MKPKSHIGDSPPRIDAIEKLTGATAFGIDVSQPGMLAGVILRSPHAHARIRHVRAEAARRLDGVKAVVTANTPGGERIFARDEVRYVGEKVAAVAAMDRRTAARALALIEVDYEPLPASTVATVEGGNVRSHSQAARGNVEDGFRQSHCIIENTYRIPWVHQGYLEPHATVAHWDASGHLSVWTSTQGPYMVRQRLAQMFQLPLTAVTVTPTAVGGAFGGKNSLFLEPVCALLSRQSGRPVKMTMSREEEFLDSSPSPDCTISIRMGAIRDGLLMAQEVSIVWNAGAYGGIDLTTFFERTRGLYVCPNFHADVYTIYTNTLTPGPYRAPGAVPVTFAYESAIDELVRALKIDPIEFRLKNAASEGYPDLFGRPYPKMALAESLRRAAEHVDWKKRKREPGVGWGVACAKWVNAGLASGLTLLLNEDGTLTLSTGAVDIAGTNTGLAQILAEEMGLPLTRVRVVVTDTDGSPLNAPSAASRVTYGVGKITIAAAQDMKRSLLLTAADMLQANMNDLEYAQGAVRSKSGAKRSMSLSELALERLHSHAGPLCVTATADEGYWHDKAPTFLTQLAEVEVDAGTGAVRVRRMISAQDVGRAINPELIKGQIEGGLVQGMGWALMEGMVFDRGQVLNRDLVDYHIPTAADAPELEALLLEVPSPGGPYGAKGVGEAAVTAGAAAIANAVFDACGARVTELPITPDKVLGRNLTTKTQRHRETENAF